MSIHRLRCIATLLLIASTAAIVAGCGGSDDTGTGPRDDNNNQTASVVATPTGATISRGGTTNVTVVYSATNGLVIGSSFTIQRQYAGITVDQNSTTGSTPLITKTYSIGADASVPTGTHIIRFSTPVTGYTGSGPAPSTAVAEFSLTVNP